MASRLGGEKMTFVMSRRSLLAGLAAMTTPASARAASYEVRMKLANDRLAMIEKREGGRLGVAILDPRAVIPRA